ncbi:ABC transporter permease [Robertkochia aurantiaca]|uniref:ABC transporter permease n=1 Tax=Robertkochia aurantiaca TaxID=2873700 RepID=UPI001CCEC967|nr:ABC transporter permease [Robertkochia sp. 3YJGBD-33]
MIRNYFIIAWRNLSRNKVYSLINILGLAIGMAVTMLIGLWIYDEITYNDYFTKSERIAQVYQTQTFNGKKGTGPAIPRPLEAAMREDYGNNFNHIVMSSWQQTYYLQNGDKNLRRDGHAWQNGAIDMFGFEIIKGDRNGLEDPNSIMLSENTAEELFGDADPIGKVIKVNSEHDMMVTAIFRNIPENNTFDEVEFMVPWQHYADTNEWIANALQHWGNNSFQMFVEIKEGKTMEEVSQLIGPVKYEKAEGEKEYDPVMFLHPMKDWYLRGDFENGENIGGRIENLWLFGTIGLFVLLLACINFMNLSTARSEKRAKEVGIRKTLGSERPQLVRQFLAESLFIVMLSYLLAMIMVQLSIPSFNELSGKTVEIPWGEPVFWICCLSFILITAFLAGSYPALYLSSFNPVTVLKGTFKAGRYASLPRKVLVVTQFSISVALIIGTLVVMKQIDHSKNRPVGYNKEGLIQIPVFSKDFEGKYDLMHEAFLRSGGAVAMSGSMSPVTSVWSNRSGWTWEGKQEGFQEDFAWVEVTHEYPSSMGLIFTDGRDFSREFASDSNAVILNETAVRYMGIKDPVGKLIRDEDTGEEAQEPMKIIGVVKDMVMQSAYKPVKQTLFVFSKEGNINYYNLRLNPEKSVKENLELIEQTFKTHFPALPFQFEFVDENYALKFRAEERIASLAAVFTVLAIFISCLGLFGLASFVAEQRTKEIGIRKVLGASVSNLWLMLSREFLLLVMLSLLIAIPIAYYIMQNWITKFDYRTNISWWIFISAGLGAIFLTIFTISFQAVRAASGNPVKSLRDE